MNLSALPDQRAAENPLRPAVADDKTDLDNAQFSVREAAAKELEKLGSQAEGPIQKALSATPPLETRRRLERILETGYGVPEPITLRDLRAIMVLERIGSPEARKILELLARGAPAALQTREAKQALERVIGALADL